MVSAAAEPLEQPVLAAAVAPLVSEQAVQAVSWGVRAAGKWTVDHAGTLSATDATTPHDTTIYEIGSVSKVFTGLLLAEAVVRGEVTLDTTLASLLPESVVLPDGAGERVTLRMLATHTSGLPRIPAELPTDDLRDPYGEYDEAELWATLRHVKLDFEPGTQAGYSNLAVGLLGMLLAREAGLSYDALLAARITGPLGMTDTAVELTEAQQRRLAPGSNAAGLPRSPWRFKALAGCGGIRSTLADMTRFADVMLHPAGTPLEAAIELSWAPQNLTATYPPGGQALGWLVAGDRQTRWHNGMTGGFHAAIFVNRERGIAAVWLSNRSTPVGTVLTEELMRRAAGMRERTVPNLDRVEVALSEAELDRCVGTYSLKPGFDLVVERQDRALILSPTGQARDRLYAESATTFFSRRVAADLVFELPADGGPATAVTLQQGGRVMRAPRS